MADVGTAHRQVQAGVRLTQRLLRALPLGDVVADADEADDVPVPVAVGSLGREVGAGHAAGAQLVFFGGGHP